MVAQRNTADAGSEKPGTPDDATVPGTPGAGDGGVPGDVPPAGGGIPAAAPLEPPQPRGHHDPPAPVPAGPASVPLDTPARTHIAIVDHDGNELGPDDLFEDPGPHTTYMVARGRIYRQYRPENSITATATQLLYARGTRVPRDQAEHLRHAIRQAMELRHVLDQAGAAAAEPG